jgi:hypothetical protein
MSAIIVPLNRWTSLPLGILCLWALHLGVKQGNAALLILFAWGFLGAVLHQYRRSRDGKAAGFDFSVDEGCTSDSGCGGGCGGCGGD